MRLHVKPEKIVEYIDKMMYLLVLTLKKKNESSLFERSRRELRNAKIKDPEDPKKKKKKRRMFGLGKINALGVYTAQIAMGNKNSIGSLVVDDVEESEDFFMSEKFRKISRNVWLKDFANILREMATESNPVYDIIISCFHLFYTITPGVKPF